MTKIDKIMIIEEDLRTFKMRDDGRDSGDIRKIKIIKDFTMYAEGSILIECGNTKVICTASVSDRIPLFLKGSGKGWLTAEYSMLPRATGERTSRESAKGRQTGRTMEIQRLIGRALRSSIDLEKIGERTITIDCDVIQADGGTRTTSITGGFIALGLAIKKLLKTGVITENPVLSYVAAISVGIVNNTPMVDLKYSEDSFASVDMNVVMNDENRYIEVQGTGEEATYSRDELDTLLDMASESIKKIIAIQKEMIGEIDE